MRKIKAGFTDIAKQLEDYTLYNFDCPRTFRAAVRGRTEVDW